MSRILHSFSNIYQAVSNYDITHFMSQIIYFNIEAWRLKISNTSLNVLDVSGKCYLVSGKINMFLHFVFQNFF